MLSAVVSFVYTVTVMPMLERYPQEDKVVMQLSEIHWLDSVAVLPIAVAMLIAAGPRDDPVIVKIICCFGRFPGLTLIKLPM